MPPRSPLRGERADDPGGESTSFCRLPQARRLGVELVGYAVLGEDPSLDRQVLPEYEWSGIEAEAMAWAEARVAELRERDAQRWGGPIVSGARQDNEKRIAFLEQHGFRTVNRYLDYVKTE